MDLFNAFNVLPEVNRLKSDGSVWIVAVSGGIDSMVLLHLLVKSGFKVEAAHMNFRLRGKESEEDAVFVQKQAAALGVKCHVHLAETQAYAAERKISTQMAARELRYAYFDELLKAGAYAGLATAHHATDNAETMLINLLRGAGLEGLSGIPSSVHQIWRPLIHFTRDEIEEYAQEQKNLFREDSSNFSDKYIRNKIRHHVLPIFKEINPTFEQRFLNSAHILRDAALVLNAQAEEMMKGCVDPDATLGIRLEISKLKSFPQYEVILYYLLNRYAVNAAMNKDILQSLENPPGAVFLTRTHKIVRDREHLVIIPLDQVDQGFEFELSGPGQFETGVGLFRVEKLAREQVRMTDSKSIALLDADHCSFPIQVRSWNIGDTFSPLGMTGTKLLSDFFTDEKVDATLRNKIPVLISDGNIIWVAGMRISHLHKISGKTQTVFRITWTPQAV
jgi:tRNA(Ile)-lysidine synthase